MKDPETGLTPKQKRFCELYADYKQPKYYGNGTQCALAVYDIAQNIDRENTAASIATELLRKPAIKAHIKALQHQQVEEIDEDYIVSEIARLKKLAEWKGNFNAAMKGAEMLGKWKALFTERQITQSESLEDLVLSESKPKSEKKPATSTPINSDVPSKVTAN